MLNSLFQGIFDTDIITVISVSDFLLCIILALVAGTFSLVRFRSVPGTAKEIGTLFLAMGAGLIAGMGYLGFSLLFTVILCAVFILYNHQDDKYGKHVPPYI